MPRYDPAESPAPHAAILGIPTDEATTQHPGARYSPPGDPRGLDPVLVLQAEIQEDIQQIESRGCVVKDLDRGLVDFLARRGRQQVFLCWHRGEPEIRFWHGLQEGFAGRKPLPEDPLD